MKNFSIKIKRIYDSPSADDGLRILVDRLWPRGVSKERAHIDYWYKEIAPSIELREWFGHKQEHFKEFENKYKKELEQQTELLKKIKDTSAKQSVTLIYAAKDTEMNQAVVLKKILEKQLN